MSCRVLLPAALALAGCVPTFQDDLSTLSSPRLLSIRAEPAEAKPGADVELSALVALPQANASAPVLSWSVCTSRKPLTELGPINPACLVPPGADSGVATPLGSANALSLTLPSDGCELFGPVRPGDGSGRPVDPDATGGYYQPVTAFLGEQPSIGAVRLSCPLPDATPGQIVAFNSRYRPNQNPDFSRIALTPSGGSAVTVDDTTTIVLTAGAAVALDVTWPICPATPECGNGLCEANEDVLSCAEDCTTPKGCAGAESYAWFDRASGLVVDRREAMRLSWYASAGQFAAAVTGRDESELDDSTSNTWSAPAAPGNVQFWLVLRDSRGGQSFRTFSVDVR